MLRGIVARKSDDTTQITDLGGIFVWGNVSVENVYEGHFTGYTDDNPINKQEAISL